MSNILWKSLLVSPAILGASLLVSAGAIAATAPTKTAVNTFAPVKATKETSIKLAAPQNQLALNTFSTSKATKTTVTSSSQLAGKPQVIAQVSGAPAQDNVNNVLDQVNRYSNEGRANTSVSQVTSVSQFSDVQPTDWAFQALQSLVERYGCIAGYPDKTFRGNRAMTRYEFAAGLNACLNRVNELIATATADLVTKEDLATLQRLQEEFSAELATLRGRVDSLEARTAQLEGHQFSTTTKLVGEAIFAVSKPFGDRDRNNNRSIGDRNNVVLQDRVRLDLQTSFTGKDTLHTRIATGNARGFDLPGSINGTPNSQGTQNFNIGNGNGNNSTVIDWLAYYFPLGKSQIYVAGYGGIHSDYAPTVNPYFEDFDGGNGALSAFAQESPIYRIGGGAGGGVNLAFGKSGILSRSSLTLGYLASKANDPRNGAGLANGDYAALAQLNFNLNDRISLAATYVNAYHTTGQSIFNLGGTDGSASATGTAVTGTAQANNPLAVVGGNTTLRGPLSSNSYGLEAAVRPTKNISLSGFFGTTNVQSVGPGVKGHGNLWYWGGGVALPDFGKKGNVLGFFGGVEPTLRDFSFNGNRQRFSREYGYHVEAFYKYRVSDNISVTPGVIYQMSPGQDSRNADAIIGTLRTTFTF
jgi:Carbohydrate-selective porin, OprB family/S-layer homology domain